MGAICCCGEKKQNDVSQGDVDLMWPSAAPKNTKEKVSDTESEEEDLSDAPEPEQDGDDEKTKKRKLLLLGMTKKCAALNVKIKNGECGENEENYKSAYDKLSRDLKFLCIKMTKDGQLTEEKQQYIYKMTGLDKDD